MTKQTIKKAAQWFLVVLTGLASISCSATIPVMGNDDLVGRDPKFAAVPHLTQRADGLKVAADESPSAEQEAAYELRRIRRDELTPEIIEKAVEILKSTAGQPLGAEVEFELEGKSFVGKTEHHYREPGSAKRPWGLHRGVSMFVKERVS